MRSSPPDGHRSRRRRWDWLLLLLALLMSFGCVFFSTWLAISRPPKRLAAAALLPQSRADYGGLGGESRGFAPLRPDVAAEAARDSSALRLTLPASVGGSPGGLAMVPLPSTPTPSPGPAPALVVIASSSPYATATVVRSPVAPTGTAQPPTGTPTSASATATGVATNTPPPAATATGAMSPTPTPGTPTPTATFPPTAATAPTPTEAPPDKPDATHTPTLSPTPTATYTPTPANRAPVALDDAAVTDEDVPASIHVVANDTDPDLNLDVSSVVSVTNPLSGTLSSAASGYITYTPLADLHGVDTFTYQVCDTGMPVLCDTATVTITIVPVNDPPTAQDDEAHVALDTPTAIAVLLNDSDVDGNLDVTSVAVVTDPSGGTLSVDGAGEITYTPGPGFAGPDSFRYQVCDTGVPVLCSTAAVTVSVNNLALGKPAAESSFQNDQEAGDKAVDGNLGTFWRTANSSSLPSEWIVVDLGSTMSISQAVLRWGNSYATSYTIQVSPDNLAWTPVFTTTVADGGTDTITFSTTPARYVKFDSTAWSGEPWRIWLREFEIYP